MAYETGDRVEPGIWHLKVTKGARKRKGIYLVEVSYPDPETWQRVRKRQTFNRIDLARQWRDAMLDDEKRAKLLADRAGRGQTFSDFTVEYLQHWGRERKPSTLARETSRIVGILNPEFGKRPLPSITRKDIDVFLTRRRDQGASAATTNRDLCRIKNILRMAQDWGLIAENPAIGIKQARESIVEQDFLTEEETARLIRDCDERIRALVTVAVYTGMRWGELTSLAWKDVHFDRTMIHIRDPKNREDRHVPMSEAVNACLQSHRSTQAKEAGGIRRHVFVNSMTGKPWKDVRGAFAAALRAAKIERHFPFKNLRHTAASHMVMRGVDIRTVGKILGHKTLQVTLRYANLSPEHLRAAVEKLDFGSSLKVR